MALRAGHLIENNRSPNSKKNNKSILMQEASWHYPVVFCELNRLWLNRSDGAYITLYALKKMHHEKQPS